MAQPPPASHSAQRHGRHYLVTIALADPLELLAMPGAAEAVIAALHACEQACALRSHAWVVLPDRVLWMFELGAASPDIAISRFAMRSARAVNACLRREGPVWWLRACDELGRGEDLRRHALRLIAEPMRAGWVDRVECWPYWWCASFERGAREPACRSLRAGAARSSASGDCACAS